MSKRKAGVNDIIYELDNDDIEISSEDEAKEPKINRLETNESDIIALDESKTQIEDAQVVSVNLAEEEVDQNNPVTNSDIGGKTILDSPDNNINNSEAVGSISPIADETESKVDNNKKIENMNASKTTIYNEDIIIDSPTSNSDLGVVGCENRTPLVTVRFRDRKLASSYKNKLKAFMLSLIKLHEKENSPGLDSETDIELDIWPEDLNDEEDSEDEPVKDNQDNLFFIDTDPGSNRPFEIPTYKNVSTVICNPEEKEASQPLVFRRGPTCFNCDGAHQLRECVLPKNNLRIAEKRKLILGTRVGRYHVEDEQKYGHLIPGRISGQLRHALGLKRHELPPHIYRMRLLGYPPGWLEEARISHSGITMFDSTGSAILDPEDEEGEVCEPGCKDKFDIKKILDFPGFNVPFSSRYKEEGHQYGMPPMSEQDSKIAMLQMLAPNAMKAYKRKKLALFPSASNNASAHEVAEMDLDSGDEVAEFPSVPPLPDDAPPPPPPPPPRSPSPPPAPPGVAPDSPGPAPPSPPGPAAPAKLPDREPEAKVDSDDDKSADDLEVVEVIEVKDIPVPAALSITIDDDDDFVDENNPGSGRESPSLDDLEMKKKLLLDALLGDNGEEDDSINISIADPDAEVNDNKQENEPNDMAMNVTELDEEIRPDLPLDTETTNERIPNIETLSPTKETATQDKDAVLAVSTPESKTGKVKTTLYGTPVINVASPYVKLPSDDKFAKDICDVINFENLPNSTGKYKKICNILKRVKNEVDRIQDS